MVLTDGGWSPPHNSRDTFVPRFIYTLRRSELLSGVLKIYGRDRSRARLDGSLDPTPHVRVVVSRHNIPHSLLLRGAPCTCNRVLHNTNAPRSSSPHGIPRDQDIIEPPSHPENTVPRSRFCVSGSGIPAPCSVLVCGLPAAVSGLCATARHVQRPYSSGRYPESTLAPPQLPLHILYCPLCFSEH